MTIENLFPNKVGQDRLNELINTQNLILSAIASHQGGLSVQSWADIQTILRMGLASQIFSVGDQLICERGVGVNVQIGNRLETVPGITNADVDLQTFLDTIGKVPNGDSSLIFDGMTWTYDGQPISIANYGITVTGSPQKGDSVLLQITTEPLVWDIIGIDHDTPEDGRFSNSLKLQLHDCLNENTIGFSANEALYYAKNGLPAGTYNFSVSNQPFCAEDAGKTFQFTLTQDLPAGGQIALQSGTTVSLNERNVYTYTDATATEPIETVTLSEGSEGTALGIADGTFSELNCIERVLAASNNYLQSDIRRYLNSRDDFDNTWEATNVFSRPDRSVFSQNGFLHGFGSDFLSVLGKVKKKTAINTIENAESVCESSELIFLLSASEVYAENFTEDGTPYAYYSDASSLSAPGNGADINRIKSQNGIAKDWWLRSASRDSVYNTRCVNPSGSVYTHYASTNRAIVPACCIV